MLLTCMCVKAQTPYTETFESFTGVGQSFTSNGLTFALVAKLQLYDAGTNGLPSGLGYGGSDNFVDNGCGSCHIANTSYLTTSGAAAFRLNSLWFYASSYTAGDVPTNDGTITFRGKLNGTTVFTLTKSSGWPTSFASNNGFTFFNFASNGSWANSYTAADVTGISIDTLYIDMGGNFLYEAFDNLIWTKSPPVVTSTAATTICATTAVLGGNATNTGSSAITERGVVWGTSSNPTTSGNKLAIGSGAGTFSNTVSGLTANTLYHFRSYAINATGTSYGTDLTFTTATAPSVTTSPSSSGVCAAGNTSFTVAASGSSLTYRWQVNTGSGYTNISNGGVYTNATTATLNITGATAGMSGYMYRCVVTGVCSLTATSSGATLTVNSLPSITSHPSASTVCASSNTSFTVAASGTSLTYQWQVNTGSGYNNVSNGGVYSTATTATLNITGATAGMNGYQYRCAVSGTCTPTATSNGATLTVNASPAVSTHPSASAICSGSNTTFTVAASGASLTYQWQVNTGSGYNNISNGGVYSTATTATLNIASATVGMNGYEYRCVVSGTCTPTATSNSATLTINTSPSVSTHPSASTICESSNTTFTVVAGGSSPTYQWQVNTGSGYNNVSNTGVYSNATTATLSITAATAAMNSYQYRCVVSGTCTPSATSNGATLTVNTLPSVSSHPSSATVCAGSNTSFSVTATGTSTTYQWQVNTGSGYSNISNTGVYSTATTVTLNITGATTGMNGYLYRCVVSGTCTPAATSNAATLSVNSVPSVTLHPSSASACSGSNTSFTVAASGTSLTYQWQENSGSGYNNISNTGVYSDATTATLSITGASGSMNAYQYRCVVSGACTPQATSNAATLTVNSAPSVDSGPSAAGVCEGGNTSFSVTASGTSLSYQWQLNSGSGFSNVSDGGVYSTATTASLTITGATTAMNGYLYRCVVSGTCSPTATSSGAALTINTAPSVTSDPSASAICLSTGTSFSATASGSGLTYQWEVNSGSGYSTVSNSAVYSGATTATLSLTGVTTAMNGYLYRCVVSGTCSPFQTSASAALTVYDANTWTGATSNDVNTGSNWCGGSVPATSSDITISGTANDLFISSGTFTVNNLTLGAGTNIALSGGIFNVEGDISGSGTITSTGGVIGFTGSAAQDIPSGLFTSDNVTNLTIANDMGVTLNGSLELTGVLTVTDGIFATNDELTLVSDASGTATVAALGSGAGITGNVNAQRYVPAVNRTYRMFSPVVSGFTFSQLIDNMFLSGPGGSTNGFDNSPNNNSSIYTYREDPSGAGRGWKGITNITNSLAAGNGAIVFVRGDRSLASWYTAPFPSQNAVTFDVAGTLNQGDISPTLTYNNTGNAGEDGWNLVGNPYASPIDWTSLSKNNLSGFFYTYDPATSSYVASNGTNYIAQGQAFFVQATGSSPALTFSESAKTLNAPTAYFKSAPMLLQARMTRDSLHSDIAWLEFKTGASKSFNPLEDARKLVNSDINFGVLLDHDSVKAQYSATPLLTSATDTFRLFANAQPGNYTFVFNGMADLQNGYHVYLIDAFTSAVQDLSINAAYPFNISSVPATSGNNRFALVLQNPALLPVKWISARARTKDDTDVEIGWQTASEENTSHYIIERSADLMRSYVPVTTVPAAGHSTTTRAYTFSDQNPFRGSQSVLYYRIRQVDQDGTEDVSQVCSVQKEAPRERFSVYPNPAKDQLYVRGIAPAGTVELYNELGVPVAVTFTREGEGILMDVSDLCRGMYIVRFKPDDGMLTDAGRFMKE
jgi:hypothetical protein